MVRAMRGKENTFLSRVVYCAIKETFFYILAII